MSQNTLVFNRQTWLNPNPTPSSPFVRSTSPIPSNPFVIHNITHNITLQELIVYNSFDNVVLQSPSDLLRISEYSEF